MSQFPRASFQDEALRMRRVRESLRNRAVSTRPSPALGDPIADRASVLNGGGQASLSDLSSDQLSLVQSSVPERLARIAGGDTTLTAGDEAVARERLSRLTTLSPEQVSEQRLRQRLISSGRLDPSQDTITIRNPNDPSDTRILGPLQTGGEQAQGAPQSPPIPDNLSPAAQGALRTADRFAAAGGLAPTGDRRQDALNQRATRLQMEQAQRLGMDPQLIIDRQQIVANQRQEQARAAQLQAQARMEARQQQIENNFRQQEIANDRLGAFGDLAEGVGSGVGDVLTPIADAFGSFTNLRRAQFEQESIAKRGQQEREFEAEQNALDRRNRLSVAETRARDGGGGQSPAADTPLSDGRPASAVLNQIRLLPAGQRATVFEGLAPDDAIAVLRQMDPAEVQEIASQLPQEILERFATQG